MEKEYLAQNETEFKELQKVSLLLPDNILNNTSLLKIDRLSKGYEVHVSETVKESNGGLTLPRSKAGTKSFLNFIAGKITYLYTLDLEDNKTIKLVFNFSDSSKISPFIFE